MAAKNSSKKAAARAKEVKGKDRKEGAALPSEAPGAVVCGITVTNSNGTAYFNIATNDNHGDGQDVTHNVKRQALPKSTENPGSSVNAGGGIYYFCTLNCYYGASSGVRDDNPNLSDKEMHGNKRARIEDHHDADREEPPI